MRIGLFIPCFIDAFFPEVGIATLELLERFGHEVLSPRDQTCCGQPMADNGFNVDPADIVVNLHHAYRRAEFRERHYAAFHTGPSATADIEGVLIHGPQGVRSLSVLPPPQAAGDITH
jgi:Fe-S oxidoreductase